MKKSFPSAIACFGVLGILFINPLRAQLTTFAIDSWDLYSYQSEIIITQNGLTMTLSNPDSPTGLFLVDQDGLYLSPDDGAGMTTSFNIHFDADVLFDSYEIGYINSGTEGFFTLTNPSGSDSQNNPLDSVGTYNFNMPFVLHVGQIATLTVTQHTNFYDFSPLSQIKYLTVDMVPEPFTWTLLAAGGALILVALRRRKARN